MKPFEANTYNKAGKLERDNISTKNSWILAAGTHVTITNQKVGKDHTGSVKLSYKEMEKFARWFLGLPIRKKHGASIHQHKR